MENKVIDNKTRRYCLYIGLLVCLVAVTAMAGHAAAAGWYLADRDGTQEGDLSGTFNSALDDQKILRYWEFSIWHRIPHNTLVSLRPRPLHVEL